MNTMENLVLVINLLASLALIGLVMLQQGKGAEAGASFGAGASQTVFGGAGSWNFLSKSTAILAVVVFVTSIALAVIAADRTDVSDELIPAVEEVPAAELQDELPVVEDAEIPADDEVPVIEDAADSEIPQSE